MQYQERIKKGAVDPAPLKTVCQLSGSLSCNLFPWQARVLNITKYYQAVTVCDYSTAILCARFGVAGHYLCNLSLFYFVLPCLPFLFCTFCKAGLLELIMLVIIIPPRISAPPTQNSQEKRSFKIIRERITAKTGVRYM